MKLNVHLELFKPAPEGIGFYYRSAGDWFDVTHNEPDVQERFKLLIYVFGWAKAFGAYDPSIKHLHRKRDGATIGSLFKRAFAKGAQS